jgi:hypothetical protein
MPTDCISAFALLKNAFGLNFTTASLIDIGIMQDPRKLFIVRKDE